VVTQIQTTRPLSLQSAFCLNISLSFICLNHQTSFLIDLGALHNFEKKNIDILLQHCPYDCAIDL